MPALSCVAGPSDWFTGAVDVATVAARYASSLPALASQLPDPMVNFIAIIVGRFDAMSLKSC